MLTYFHFQKTTKHAAEAAVDRGVQTLACICITQYNHVFGLDAFCMKAYFHQVGEGKDFFPVVFQGQTVTCEVDIILIFSRI